MKQKIKIQTAVFSFLLLMAPPFLALAQTGDGVCSLPGQYDPSDCVTKYCGDDLTCQKPPPDVADSCLYTSCGSASLYYCNQNTGKCESAIDLSNPPNGSLNGSVDLCQNKICTYGCIKESGQCRLAPSGNSNSNVSAPTPNAEWCNHDPKLVYQNGVCLPPKDQYCNGGFCVPDTLTELIIMVIKFLLYFSGLVAVVMLILGGYWYMAAGGNEELAEKGKKTITNFILGLVVIIMAYSIVTIISSTITHGQ